LNVEFCEITHKKMRSSVAVMLVLFAVLA